MSTKPPGRNNICVAQRKLVDWAEKWEHPVHSGFLAPITEQPAFYSGSGFNSGLIEAGLDEV